MLQKSQKKKKKSKTQMTFSWCSPGMQENLCFEKETFNGQGKKGVP